MPTQSRREKGNGFVLSQRHVRNGQVFSIGGGLANTTSLLELVNTIGELHGHAPGIRFANWRTADQRFLHLSDES